MPILDLSLILIWVAIQIPFVVLTFRANPPKEIRQKYPYSLRVQSVIPFMQRWKAKMEPADVYLWEKYKRRCFLQVGVFFGSWVLLQIYIYFKFKDVLW